MEYLGDFTNVTIGAIIIVCALDTINIRTKLKGDGITHNVGLLRKNVNLVDKIYF